MRWPWTRRKRPSYETGKPHDPAVERLQDPEYRADDLKDAIRKSVKNRPKTS